MGEQIITDQKSEQPGHLPDSAAIFAAALSLWLAYKKFEHGKKSVNFSGCYNGMDQFMREVMRIASLFETWACQHVAFNELNDVWPNLLEDRFGDACLSVEIGFWKMVTRFRQIIVNRINFRCEYCVCHEAQ